jgi:hypothetical protein
MKKSLNVLFVVIAAGVLAGIVLFFMYCRSKPEPAACGPITILRSLDLSQAVYRQQHGEYADTWSKIFSVSKAPPEWLLSDKSFVRSLEGINYEFTLACDKDTYEIRAIPLAQGLQPDIPGYSVDQTGIIKQEGGKPLPRSSPNIRDR